MWSTDHGPNPEGFISHPRQTTEMGEGAPCPLLVERRPRSGESLEEGRAGGTRRGGSRESRIQTFARFVTTQCTSTQAGGKREAIKYTTPANLDSKRSRDSSRPNAPTQPGGMREAIKYTCCAFKHPDLLLRSVEISRPLATHFLRIFNANSLLCKRTVFHRRLLCSGSPAD